MTRSTYRRLAAGLVLLAGLAAATASGASTVPWITIASAPPDATPCLVPGPRAAFVAGTLGDTRRFASALNREDRRKLRVIDYRRFAVVAVFRCFRESGHSFELERIVRKNQVLEVTTRHHGLPPGTGALPGLQGHYEVVAVRKTRLGAPLPRRVTVVERAAEEDPLQ